MIIFSNSKNAASLTRAVKEGRFKVITKGVYIDIKSNENEQIVEKIKPILEHLKVEGFISYASGLYNNFIDENNTIYVTGNKAREVILNDIKVIVTKGNEKEMNHYAAESLNNLKIKVPNVYRAALQNFSIRKVDQYRINKELALKALIKEAEKFGNDAWQVLYTNLNTHANILGYEKEAQSIIVELDKYRKDKNLDILDSKRVVMFKNLLEKVQSENIISLDNFDKTDSNACEHLAFFEAYFSNYIEGTEFEINEAYSIVFDPKVHYVRAKDSHDVKKSYTLMLNNIQNPINITTSEQYIKQLKAWHKELMEHRGDEILVGEFKHKKNKAGSTTFVIPEKVEEMLKYSFQLSQGITNLAQKAFFLKTTFTEIHPFEDGNGRMSRIILNNYLSLAGKKRIIVPNVYREDYILGLKAFSNSNNPIPIVRALNKAAQITNAIPYHTDITDLIDFLNKNSAFCLPQESMWGVKPPNEPQEGEVNQLELFSNIGLRKNKF